MNQKRAMLFAVGCEVGNAYNVMIQNILDNPELSKWKYVLTLEDDNLPNADLHIRLLETIEWGNYDAVSGIYFTKGDISAPMVFGDSEEYAKTGVLDFRPLDVRKALEKGQIIECNGIAMGAALFRMDVFKKILSPWFVTVADMIPDKGASCFTQDLNMCEKMKKAGMRLAVDCRNHVGHLDINSGTVY